MNLIQFTDKKNQEISISIPAVNDDVSFTPDTGLSSAGHQSHIIKILFSRFAETIWIFLLIFNFTRVIFSLLPISAMTVMIKPQPVGYGEQYVKLKAQRSTKEPNHL